MDKNQIKEAIENNKVVLFMKGNRTFPQCGFSAQVVQILEHFGVSYKEYDVLADEDLRVNIKEFSDWPTIPQLYIDGEFMGGCDIIREMYDAGELVALFEGK